MAAKPTAHHRVPIRILAVLRSDRICARHFALQSDAHHDANPAFRLTSLTPSQLIPSQHLNLSRYRTRLSCHFHLGCSPTIHRRRPAARTHAHLPARPTARHPAVRPTLSTQTCSNPSRALPRTEWDLPATTESPSSLRVATGMPTSVGVPLQPSAVSPSRLLKPAAHSSHWASRMQCRAF